MSRRCMGALRSERVMLPISIIRFKNNVRKVTVLTGAAGQIGWPGRFCHGSRRDGMFTEVRMLGISFALKAAPALAAVPARALGGAVRLGRALAHRAAVRQLAEFDDRMLADIGLSRSEVMGALAEPLHRDPSTVLLLRTLERRPRVRQQGVTPKLRPLPERPAATVIP